MARGAGSLVPLCEKWWQECHGAPYGFILWTYTGGDQLPIVLVPDGQSQRWVVQFFSSEWFEIDLELFCRR